METVIHSSPIQEPARKRLLFRNLTEKEKQLLVPGGAGVLGLISGAGLYHYFGLKQDATDVSTPITESVETPEAEVVCVYTEAPFAHSVTEDMSFNEAFSSARQELGMGGFFEWRGNTYNTYYKEEWDQLTSSEQQDYMVSVHESTDYSTLQEVDIANNDIHLNADPSEINSKGHDDSSADSEDYYESVVFDLDGDGVLDSVALDMNNNGYVDAVGVDTNQDGTLDIYALDTEDMDTLDTIILDADQDGLDANDPYEAWDNQDEIRIDELKESIYPTHQEDYLNADESGEIDPDFPETHSI